MCTGHGGYVRVVVSIGWILTPSHCMPSEGRAIKCLLPPLRLHASRFQRSLVLFHCVWHPSRRDGGLPPVAHGQHLVASSCSVRLPQRPATTTRNSPLMLRMTT